MKFECIHVDTCLPCYWGGHHWPHIQIAARNRMTIGQLRDALRNELAQGAVMGSNDDARMLSADLVKPEEEKEADRVTRAAYAAIRRDVHMPKGAKSIRPFRTLDDRPDDYDGEEVYAYFVFRRV